MHIAILGTGRVGRTLAAAFDEQGHDVTIGTRDVAATMARTEPDRFGSPPFHDWAAEHPGVSVASFGDAARQGELVVNATSGGVSLDVLRQAGAENLAGKVLVDVANPLDGSHGFPPTLLVKDTDSLAEQIQRAFPEARVVKTLNTMTASVMVDPKQVGGGDHTVFVSGDDAGAKATVTDLLRRFGWTDIIDLGDLSSARGAEMLLPIWLRLRGTFGGSSFNFKIVR